MTVEDWHDDSRHCLAVTGGDQTSRLLALFNAETAAVEFTLPEGAWRLEVDSAEPARAAGQPFDRTCTVQPLSVVILASAPRRS
jgi:pullulanase/glycogen debranching enzyme